MPWRRKEKGGGEKERPVEKSRSGASGEEEDIDIDIGTASSVGQLAIALQNACPFLTTHLPLTWLYILLYKFKTFRLRVCQKLWRLRNPTATLTLSNLVVPPNLAISMDFPRPVGLQRKGSVKYCSTPFSSKNSQLLDRIHGASNHTKFGNVWAFPPPHYPANARSLRSVTSKRSGWAFSFFADRSVLSCELEYVLDPSDFQEVLSDRRYQKPGLAKFLNQGNLFTFGGVFRDINSLTS
ncbi:hypothetical protein D5086_031452 [Populus alba]|uniref:Uncharacterized protein n=1 Tax=Populus alba TaxID=43335 RepID=A0ACC4AIN1_POPAL